MTPEGTDDLFSVEKHGPLEIDESEVHKEPEFATVQKQSTSDLDFANHLDVTDDAELEAYLKEKRSLTKRRDGDYKILEGMGGLDSSDSYVAPRPDPKILLSE